MKLRVVDHVPGTSRHLPVNTSLGFVLTLQALGVTRTKALREHARLRRWAAATASMGDPDMARALEAQLRRCGS